LTFKFNFNLSLTRYIKNWFLLSILNITFLNYIILFYEKAVIFIFIKYNFIIYKFNVINYINNYIKNNLTNKFYYIIRNKI
jgi:hypothetical protein